MNRLVASCLASCSSVVRVLSWLLTINIAVHASKVNIKDKDQDFKILSPVRRTPAYNRSSTST